MILEIFKVKLEEPHIFNVRIISMVIKHVQNSFLIFIMDVLSVEGLVMRTRLWFYPFSDY